MIWFESIDQMDRHFRPIFPPSMRTVLRHPPPPRLCRRQQSVAQVIVANPLDGTHREFWLPRDLVPYLVHLADVEYRLTIRPRPVR